MRPDARLNGSDQLMRGFDYELRRAGFAGNHCQIVLALAGRIDTEALNDRVAALVEQFPILTSRPAKFFRPKWKIAGGAAMPQCRRHKDEPGLRERLFNEPLRIERGELMRFDLIERDGAAMGMVFTWTHMLMDATAAEHFLAAVGDEKLTLPAGNPQPAGAPPGWKKRLELMRKAVEQLDRFCERQPRALKTRHAGAGRELRRHVLKFTAEETARARANGARWCGVLGDAQFHAAVAVLELHRLHTRLGCATESYILPMPVGLRPKGKIEPLFSNQVDMLMVQFFPENLESIENTVAALKAQAAQSLREQSVGYGRKLSDLFSFLPLPIYMKVLKHGLKGEICSIFFGDTAAVNPRLEQFLGTTVTDFHHIAAVTPSPGLGVVFYYFRGELHVSVVHAATVLDEAEAAEFSAGLRARLLEP